MNLQGSYEEFLEISNAFLHEITHGHFESQNFGNTILMLNYYLNKSSDLETNFVSVSKEYLLHQMM